MKLLHITVIVFILSCFACTNENQEPSTPVANTDWLIPERLVLDGGPGKDGIPSINNPKFSDIDDITFMSPNDLILGIRIGDEVRGYPHSILDWHEIVNDEFKDRSFALTYCPLTGTGIGWDRNINGSKTTFGVSGLLYNTNLMPYDRLTNSTWSQQRLDCVNGELKGEKAKLFTFIETNWSTWKESFPDSKILNTDTGINRSYGRYPYGDYITNDDKILFPVTNLDETLPAKERVLGVKTASSFKVYPFGSESGTELIQDSFDGKDYIIVRNTLANFIIAYDVTNKTETFVSLDPDQLPAVIEDSNGIRYDLSGHALNVDGQIALLPLAEQFMGYWFSWPAFYSDVELY